MTNKLEDCATATKHLIAVSRYDDSGGNLFQRLPIEKIAAPKEASEVDVESNLM